MCPECKAPMVAFELGGVEIDHCVQCGGTWLDTGELEQIASLGGLEQGNLTRAILEAKALGKSSRRCPRCQRRLQVIAVGDEDPIELDRCRWGHGLWFDRGEMKTLFERFHDEEEKAVAGFFSDLFKHEFQSSGKGD